jgi:C4-type Zn-finger protein
MIVKPLCPICKAEMTYISSYITQTDHGLQTLVITWHCGEAFHSLNEIKEYSLEKFPRQPIKPSLLESV